MAQEFGKVQRGAEEPFTEIFFAVEANAMRVHRKHPSSNSRRMIEAIALALYDIKGRIEGTEIDASAFRNEDNERLEHAILMAIDPFTNEEAMEQLNKLRDAGAQVDLTTPEGLHALYELPIMCLLRLKESVEFWIEMWGPDGYFGYLDSQLGDMVESEDMSYVLVTPGGPEELLPRKKMRGRRRRSTRRNL